MSIEHQQCSENGLDLWDPELDSRLAFVEAVARGTPSNYHLPSINDDGHVTFQQTSGHGEMTTRETCSAASTLLGGATAAMHLQVTGPPVYYPVTPTRPFHYQPGFHTSPQVTAQLPQAHIPYHGQFTNTFPTNATPPSDLRRLSKRVIDVKSTENESSAPPSKKSRHINSSEKENKPEKAPEVDVFAAGIKSNDRSPEKVDKVEIISAPNSISGSVDLAAAKKGGKKWMKKEKAKLKAEEEVVNSLRSHWSDNDKTALFEWLLGPDSDKNADKLKVNPGRVFKKAAENVFNGKYNDASIKGQYDRSLKTFGYILQFESFTGGGGDADEDSFGTRIDAARQSGVYVGNLNAKTLAKWSQLGWYDLFNSRHGKSPKVTRPVVYSSSQPLSDIDSELAGGDTSNNSDDSDMSPSPVKSALSSKRKLSRSASKVSEPKYKPPSSKARQQNLASASGLAEYLKSKAELDKARFDGLKLRQQAELAKQMFADPTTPAELRAAAEAILLKALQD